MPRHRRLDSMQMVLNVKVSDFQDNGKLGFNGAAESFGLPCKMAASRRKPKPIQAVQFTTIP